MARLPTDAFLFETVDGSKHVEVVVVVVVVRDYKLDSRSLTMFKLENSPRKRMFPCYKKVLRCSCLFLSGFRLMKSFYVP